MSRYSEQLEHEAETTRWQVTQTLEELRSRITPGQVIDQVVDYARDGGATEMMRNFGRQVRDNPLPLTLIGAGIAWLMIGNGHARTNGAHRAGEAMRHTRERAEAALDRATGVVGETSAEVGEAANSAWHRTTGAAGDAATAVRDTATSTYHRVARGTSHLAGRVGDSTMAAARGTAATGRTVVDFCREQPLVLAGLGLALGAAIGALAPQRHAGDGHDAEGEHVNDNPAAAPEAIPGTEEKQGTMSSASLVTDGESG